MKCNRHDRGDAGGEGPLGSPCTWVCHVGYCRGVSSAWVCRASRDGRRADIRAPTGPPLLGSACGCWCGESSGRQPDDNEVHVAAPVGGAGRAPGLLWYRAEGNRCGQPVVRAVAARGLADASADGTAERAGFRFVPSSAQIETLRAQLFKIGAQHPPDRALHPLPSGHRLAMATPAPMGCARHQQQLIPTLLRQHLSRPAVSAQPCPKISPHPSLLSSHRKLHRLASPPPAPHHTMPCIG